MFPLRSVGGVLNKLLCEVGQMVEEKETIRVHGKIKIIIEYAKCAY